MKVLLIYSPGLKPLEIYQSIGVRAPPLGLAYIASVLEKIGHKVRIIDAPTLGFNIKMILEAVKRFKPDVVGIGSVTPTVKASYKIAKLIKRDFDKDIPIIMGGTHVSYMYTEALTEGNADYVVIGEGEVTTRELIQYIEVGKPSLQDILGIAYKLGDKVVRNRNRPWIRNLDTLPEPARHLLPMDHYTVFNKPLRIVHIMASRGCPYGCIYCSTSYYWGRRYRIRSPENVVDEIERNIERYKTNIIVFTDDELTLSKRWVIKFAREIMDRGLDINYTCGSRVNSIDREMLRYLRLSGCTAIYYGIESYNDRDLMLIRKKISISQINKAIPLTQEYGMEVAGSFIIGFPWQTVDDMKNTVKYAIKLNPDYAQFTVATPYPGTPLYYYCLKHNLIESFDWDDYTTVKPVIRGFMFTREIAGRLLSWAYRKFYLRADYIFRNIIKGRLETIGDIVSSAIKNLFEKIF